MPSACSSGASHRSRRGPGARAAAAADRSPSRAPPPRPPRSRGPPSRIASRRALAARSPPALSSASSQSAAIETASRTPGALARPGRRRVEHEPRRVVLPAAEGAEVDAGARGRLGGDDPASSSPSARRARRAASAMRLSSSSGAPREPSIDSAAWSGADRAERRARPLRAARADLRPLRRAALVRPGPALAALPRLADRGRARGHRARRRDRHGRGRASSSCGSTGCAVVGVDQSPEMLAEARRRALGAATRVQLVEARAEAAARSRTRPSTG